MKHTSLSGKFWYRYIFTAVLFFTTAWSAHAQLTVVGGLTANNIKDLLFGPDVTVSNFTVNCPNGAYGSFDGTASNIGLTGGILLTTGSITLARGPNNQGDAGRDNNGPGDKDLDDLVNGGTPCTVGGACTQPGCTGTMTSNGTCTCTQCANGNESFDACSIEMDIVPTCDQIQIHYVFGSEEYPEYVNSNVSDAFAFLISGPGITGTQNIALVPGTNLNVEIDNINANTNNQYYVNNTNGATVQYDGFTKVLTATMKVVPCETYHLKVVIADYGDGIYDSGVFLEKGGINCGTPTLTVTATDAVECCTDGSFTFTLDQAQAKALTINYTLKGTATDGVDFTGLSGTVNFPVGQTTVTVPVSAICDQLVEGQETIELFIGQAICGGSLDASATLTISDGPAVDAGPDQVICTNSANLNATGTGSFIWSPTNGLSCTTCPNPVATPATTTTYHVTLTDGNGCSVEDSVSVIVSCGPTVTATGDEICNGDCGTVEASALGGALPYTITWNPSPGTGAGPHSVCPAATTRYYVTVTDADGNSDTASALVIVNELPVLTTTTVDPLCNGMCNGSATVNASGNGGFSYAWDDPASQTAGTATGLCVGTYNVTVTDAKGCVSTTNATLAAPNALTLSTSQVDVTCNGYCDGSATVSAGGGSPGYQYVWNDPATQTAAMATGLCAGHYTVSVSDQNGCQDTIGVVITEPAGVTATVTHTDISCNGACDGTATVTASGGSGTLTYAWSDAASQGGAVATGLCAGSYTVSVTDAASCLKTLMVTVTEPTALVVTETHQDIGCWGGADGGIDLTVSGGTPNYGYQWDNGSGVQDPTGLTAGSYCVTVTDANGCSETLCVTLIEPDAIVLDTASSPASCGNDIGTASVQVVTGGTPPFTYTWDDAGKSTTSTVTGLASGTYCVTVTDANGCSDQTCVFVNDISVYPVICFTDSLTGCVPLVATFTNCTSGGGTCYWDFGDGTTSTDCNPEHTFSEPGCYDITLSVTSPEGCTSSLTKNCYVEGYPWPSADFTADPWEVNIFYPVIDFTDKSTDAVSWRWEFGDGDTSLSRNPTHVFSDTGCYDVRLVLENQYGCWDEVIRTVCVKDIHAIYFPNVFTPNKDGKNDIFMPKYYNVCELEMFIFDRWGNLVFKTTGMDGWDGKINGNDAQEDVFVWLAKGTFCDGEDFKRIGHVTLVR